MSESTDPLESAASSPQHEGPSPHVGDPYPTCLGCRWLDHAMLRSGSEPVYEDRCLHPSRERPPMPLWIELAMYLPRGEFIGTIQPPRTPEWCPVVKGE